MTTEQHAPTTTGELPAIEPSDRPPRRHFRLTVKLLIFLTAWFALRSFGNAGLWGALLVHYAARGGLEALRYPALLRNSFARPAQV